MTKLKERQTIMEQSKKLDDGQLIGYLSNYLRQIDKTGTKIIVLIGGPASGKGTLAERLAVSLGNTAVLSTDNYLKGNRDWRRANVEDVGRDPLEKYDPAFLNEQLRKILLLQEGQEIGIPIYDGQSGVAISQDPEDISPDSHYPTKVRGPQNFIIVEGDFQFVDSELMDKMVFLDVPDEVRLENRVYRDLQKRKEADDPILAEQKTRENFASRQATQFIPHTLTNREKANLVINVHASLLPTPTPETKYLYTYSIIER
jgi:uridine kinase